MVTIAGGDRLDRHKITLSPQRWVVLGCIIFAIIVPISYYYYLRIVAIYAQFYGHPASSIDIYSLDNWLGPLIRNIVEKGEYRACYDGPDATVVAQPSTIGICWSAARMPVEPLFASFVALFSRSLLTYVMLKNLLVFAILFGAVFLVVRDRSINRTVFVGLLLILFLNPIHLSVGMQAAAEESYLIGLAPLGLALSLLQVEQAANKNALTYSGIGFVSALLPMTKSSGVFPALGLSLMWLTTVRPNRRAGAIPLGIVLAVLMSWGGFIYFKTGTFAFLNTTSSLNGYNLYHGNSPFFAKYYPTYHMDEAVPEYNVTRPLVDEWDHNRYFYDLAKSYAIEHPAGTAQAVVLKLYSALFKVTPEIKGTTAGPGNLRYWPYIAGLLVGKVLMWGALIIAIRKIIVVHSAGGINAISRSPDALGALLFGGFFATYLMPFVAGFVLYRHITPLLATSIIYLLWVAGNPELAHNAGQAR